MPSWLGPWRELLILVIAPWIISAILTPLLKLADRLRVYCRSEHSSATKSATNNLTADSATNQVSTQKNASPK
jgi:hypothetical protein